VIFLELRLPRTRRHVWAPARKRPDALTFTLAIRIARSAGLFAKAAPGSRPRCANGISLLREAFVQAVRVRFRDPPAPYQGFRLDRRRPMPRPGTRAKPPRRGEMSALFGVRGWHRRTPASGKRTQAAPRRRPRAQEGRPAVGGGGGRAAAPVAEGLRGRQPPSGEARIPAIDCHPATALNRKLDPCHSFCRPGRGCPSRNGSSPARQP